MLGIISVDKFIKLECVLIALINGDGEHGENIIVRFLVQRIEADCLMGRPIIFATIILKPRKHRAVVHMVSVNDYIV